MTSSPVIDLIEFLQSLFFSMLRAKMPLTLEDFEALRDAISHEHGIGGWDDLKSTCELLWVKPSPEFSQDKFERGFEQFQARYRRSESPILPKRDNQPPAIPLGQLPSIPPRKSVSSAPEPEPSPVIQAIDVGDVAKSIQPASSKSFEPYCFPLTTTELRRTWSLLRRWVQSSYDLELDLDGTLEKIQSEGWWSDVVFKPLTMHKAELILLVDESAAMRPFSWAVQPFYDVIQSGAITPAKIYTFSSYPVDTLFTVERPRQAIAMDKFLTHCHQNRTIVLIWSDAGAALNLIKDGYIKPMEEFLVKLAPCVHQLFWLNPLPPERWQTNSARRIDQVVNGKMIPLKAGWGRIATKYRWKQVVTPW